jgi:AraC-like DNA-binding protein
MAPQGVFRAGTRRFLLPQLWAVHFYEYEADLWMGSTALRIQPGAVSITPAGMPVRYRWYGRSEHACAHFALGEGPGPAGGGGLERVPALQAPGESYTGLKQDFLEACQAWPTRPHRAAARLWEILFRLAEPPSAVSSEPGHPAVERAVERIECGLGERLRVADVAREAAISHNHLTRVFQKRFGCGVAGYIRRRRIERARHLLVETTLPVKAIAVEVGVPDLQRFNKMMRRGLGASPKALRAD